jgi:hypothetical protein
MKHTKEKWSYVYEAAPNGYRYNIRSSAGTLLASVAISNVSHERTEIEANAKLIAAAPELLRTLTNLLAIIEKDRHKGQSYILVEAEQAIKKATN